MNELSYILLVNVYICIFAAFYKLFLRKQTFFQLNRFYLLSALAVSFVIPFIQNPWLQALGVTRQIEYTITLPTVTVIAGHPATTDHLATEQLIIWVYLAGVLVFAAGLLLKLFAVKRFLADSGASVSYSFFKKIHIGRDYSGNKIICEHEKIHAAQWHSVDILFAEIVVILNWFNPVVYYFRKELKNVHEFIADEGALKSAGNKKEYAMLLLSQTFETPINNLVNTFFNQNLLKQRIMMIQKNRSKKSSLARYALLIPVFAMMLILSSAAIEPGSKDPTPQTKQSHGGKVYTEVDQTPTFPGGQNKFYEFLGKNIKYPKEMREKNIQGKVFISFVVEKDGSLSNFKILKDIGHGAGKEAVRVLAMSPKWNPGVQKGEKVRVQYTVPISYALQKEK